MHAFDADIEALATRVVDYALDRIRMRPPLDGPTEIPRLADAPTTITPTGIGGDLALSEFDERFSRACISVDHPGYLSFVPGAPSMASVLFDLVVGASSVYGGSWLEGAGAIHLENETLRWIADLAGFGPAAGGVFVSGGTAGNLSALAAARFRHRRDHGDRGRAVFLASAEAHSSVASAARIMDAEVVAVPVDVDRRLTAAAVEATVADLPDDVVDRICAVVATSGTTNLGVIDELDGLGRLARGRGWWFHVDGAYGGAALCLPELAADFAGIELADSFIVDPHKWLFGPFDSCALLYADPNVARAAHTQNAGYLDVLNESGDWNPSDYAHHLSRRARGLPLWFSLATHGTDAYRDAVRAGVDHARTAATLIEHHPDWELLWGPSLSIVLFDRPGWTADQLQQWSDSLLAAGLGLVVPTKFEGRPVLRFCIINPMSDGDVLAEILDHPGPT